MTARIDNDDTTRAIGPSRALVLDAARHARSVPSFPVERRVQLGDVARVRSETAARVSWTAVFARAYGLASRQYPQLRQIYVAWPWPRIYQDSRCVISVAVNRQFGDSERLYFGRIFDPDSRPVDSIQLDLDRFQCADPEVEFGVQSRGARLPWPVRRLLWWWRMEVEYKKRVRRSGSGAISTLAGHGVTNRLHPCVNTTSLSFGPIESDGQSLVTLQCDHRVIDGVVGARALNELCDTLRTRVADELASLGRSPLHAKQTV